MPNKIWLAGKTVVTAFKTGKIKAFTDGKIKAFTDGKFQKSLDWFWNICDFLFCLKYSEAILYSEVLYFVN